MSTEQPTSEEQRRPHECDHRWKYETFFHAIGSGPLYRIYRCNRCLETKRVADYASIGD